MCTGWLGRPSFCGAHRTMSEPTSPRPIIVDAKLAIKEVQSLKSPGVTRYLDLDRVNKQNILDLEDEEMGTESDPEVMEPPLPLSIAMTFSPNSVARIAEYVAEHDCFQEAAARARERHAGERNVVQNRLKVAENISSGTALSSTTS